MYVRLLPNHFLSYSHSDTSGPCRQVYTTCLHITEQRILILSLPRYVGNLPGSVTDAMLVDLFKQIGNIKHCKVLYPVSRQSPFICQQLYQQLQNYSQCTVYIIVYYCCYMGSRHLWLPRWLYCMFSTMYSKLREWCS